MSNAAQQFVWCEHCGTYQTLHNPLSQAEGMTPDSNVAVPAIAAPGPQLCVACRRFFTPRLGDETSTVSLPHFSPVALSTSSNDGETPNVAGRSAVRSSWRNSATRTTTTTSALLPMAVAESPSIVFRRAGQQEYVPPTCPSPVAMPPPQRNDSSVVGSPLLFPERRPYGGVKLPLRSMRELTAPITIATPTPSVSIGPSSHGTSVQRIRDFFLSQQVLSMQQEVNEIKRMQADKNSAGVDERKRFEERATIKVKESTLRSTTQTFFVLERIRKMSATAKDRLMQRYFSIWNAFAYRRRKRGVFAIRGELRNDSTYDQFYRTPTQQRTTILPHINRSYSPTATAPTSEQLQGSSPRRPSNEQLQEAVAMLMAAQYDHAQCVKSVLDRLIELPVGSPQPERFFDSTPRNRSSENLNWLETAAGNSTGGWSSTPNVTIPSSAHRPLRQLVQAQIDQSVTHLMRSADVARRQIAQEECAMREELEMIVTAAEEESHFRAQSSTTSRSSSDRRPSVAELIVRYDDQVRQATRDIQSKIATASSAAVTRQQFLRLFSEVMGKERSGRDVLRATENNAWASLAAEVKGEIDRRRFVEAENNATRLRGAQSSGWESSGSPLFLRRSSSSALLAPLPPQRVDDGKSSAAMDVAVAEGSPLPLRNRARSMSALQPTASPLVVVGSVGSPSRGARSPAVVSFKDGGEAASPTAEPLPVVPTVPIPTPSVEREVSSSPSQQQVRRRATSVVSSQVPGAFPTEQSDFSVRAGPPPPHDGPLLRKRAQSFAALGHHESHFVSAVNEIFSSELQGRKGVIRQYREALQQMVNDFSAKTVTTY